MKTRVLIVLPAYNEVLILEDAVRRVRAAAVASLSEMDVTVLIADNASTDGTAELGRRLDSASAGVIYMRVEKRGKGNAIAEAWSSRTADVYVFMDADLSTDLSALPALVTAIKSGAGLAVGSRFHPESVVRRSPLRRLLSAGYRWIIGGLLGTQISDLPCGFKAASAEVVRTIVPQVVNQAWFFDSELALRVESSGFKVAELPIVWSEARPSGRRSKVRILPLIYEYLREIWRMRKVLGPARVDPEERMERRWAMVFALLLMIASSIAPLYAAFGGVPTGYVWSGRSAFAPADLAVYLSYISQAANGKLLLVNDAGAEGALPMIQPVWSVAGILARFFGLSSLGAYHALRIMLIPPLVWTMYAALRHFVIDRSARITALPLLLFGSGAGMYVSGLLARYFPPASEIHWPTDLWMAESNVFASTLYSPHFIASWILFVLALTLLAKSFERRSLWLAVSAGVAAATLTSFHPFFAVSTALMAVIWWALWKARRGFSWRDVGAVAIFASLQVPSLGYYFSLLSVPANREALHDVNLLWSPPWPYVLIGFAGFVCLAPLGYALARKADAIMRWRSQELALWALVNISVIYVPVAFQRRLLEGLQFPLAALSGIALAGIFSGHLLPNLIRREIRPGIIGTMILMLFLPSTFLAAIRDVVRIHDRDKDAVFTQSESEMIAWLRDVSPVEGAVLSTVRTGNDVLGWAERPAYAAHWAQTISLSRKIDEIDRFYGVMTSAERLAFVRAHGIVQIVYGPRERAIGTGLQDDPAFELTYNNGANSVYEPRP